MTTALSGRRRDHVDNIFADHNPYVRWTHKVYTPVIRVETDGSRTLLGYTHKVRHSALHRTAVPGRCWMATQYSRIVLTAPSPRFANPVLEYLDELPFPRSQVVPRRAQGCDYCYERVEGGKLENPC
jgi:hypothetical protein